MTTTPPEAPSEPQGHQTDEGPRASRDEIRDLGRLRRTTEDRKVAGVAGGLARHLDIDPIILRVAFVVLAFFGGAGLILYGACWLLVPADGDHQATVHLDERSRGIALIAIGVIAALALVGDSWGAYWFPWPLAIIGLIAFLWLSRSGRHERSADRATPAPETPAGSGPVAPRYVAPAPRDPRKRGPVLFWFTVALVAFLEGVLGIVDLAGAPVADSAYPALAVGTLAVMLLVGAFVGRAGGLIALGLVASVVLVAGTAAERIDGESARYAPSSASVVQDRYTLGTGELVLDLTDVRDVAALDGRTIELSAQGGRIDVVVPDELDVHVEGSIDGPGGYEIFGRQGGGLGTDVTGFHDGSGDDTLTIRPDLQVGEITVRTE